MADLNGNFIYDNKKFNYKFRIIEWRNCRGYGAGMISYKYKFFQLSRNYFIDENRPYIFLLSKYEDMKEDELRMEIERTIIRDYNYKELKKKWN